jgi:uncharacterized protein
MLKKIGVLLFILISSNSFAQSKGDIFFSERNYKKAYWQYIKEKDSNAKFHLGYLLFNGLGVKENKSLGITFYHEATLKNNINAMDALGVLYMNGNYITKDYNKAFYYLNSSANQGNIKAKADLGELYLKDDYPNKNYESIEKLLLDANKNKNSTSAYQLSILYLNPYWKGSKNKEAFINLQWVANLLPDNQSDVEYQTQAEYKHLIAMSDVYIGYFYEHGYIGKADYKQAFSWYLKAFNNGDDYSANRIGFMFYNGIIAPKNQKEAYMWFVRGAEDGNAHSEYILGKYYLILSNTSVNSNYSIEGYRLIESSKKKGYQPVEDEFKGK